MSEPITADDTGLVLVGSASTDDGRDELPIYVTGSGQVLLIDYGLTPAEATDLAALLVQAAELAEQL